MPTIRAELVGVVVIPGDGAPTILWAGDTVPDGVTVGDHLIDEPEPVVKRSK